MIANLACKHPPEKYNMHKVLRRQKEVRIKNVEEYKQQNNTEYAQYISNQQVSEYSNVVY